MDNKKQEVPFASLIRPDLPGGKTDKNYLVVKEKMSENYFVFRVIDTGKSGRGSREVARASYSIGRGRLVLDDVWTHKNYRKLNLQKTLIELVGQEANQMKKRRMSLLSVKDAVSFYEKQGFVKKNHPKRSLVKMSRETQGLLKMPKVLTFAERRKKRRK